MSVKTETVVDEKASESNIVVKKLKPIVKDLSDKIQKGLEVDAASGVISETTTNYISNLPDNITPEIDAAVANYRTNFVAASAHAAGVIAIQAMENNANLITLTASLKMGDRDYVSHGISREVTYGYGPTNNRQSVTKAGVVITDLSIHGGDNAGQLKAARDIIGQLATEAFNNKT